MTLRTRFVLAAIASASVARQSTVQSSALDMRASPRPVSTTSSPTSVTCAPPLASGWSMPGRFAKAAAVV